MTDPSRSARRLTLRERIGGRWAVSLRAYLITAPFWIISIPINEPGASVGAAAFLKVLVVSVVAYLCMGVVLWIASGSLLRDRDQHPVPVWLAIAVPVVGAEVRAAAIVAGLAAFSIDNPVPPASRIVMSALMAAFIFPATAYALDSWDRYSRAKDALVEQLVRERMILLEQRNQVAGLRKQLVSQTEATLREALGQLEASEESSAKAGGIAAQAALELELLATSVDEPLRQTSHELARETRPVARLTWRGLLRLIAASRPYRAWMIVPIAAILYVGVFGRILPPSEALAWTIGWSLYALLISLVTNLLCVRGGRFGVAIYLTSLVFMILPAVVPLPVLQTSYAPDFPSLRWFVMLFVAGATMAIRGAPAAAGQQRGLALETLRQSVTDAEIQQVAAERETALIRRQLASYLHGELRARTTAAKLMLRHSLEVGDEQGIREAMINARRAIDVDVGKEIAPTDESLDSFLRQLSESWSGLVKIAVKLSGSEPSGGVTGVLRLLATEAVNDAVQHADADTIDLEVTSTENEATLCVRNNGLALRAAEPGLGTILLDVYARDHWQRTSLPDGRTQLVVEIRAVV